MVSDMTKGSPIKLILSFSVPMLVGNIFQQVYNFVDASVVGKFVGANALAAVGSTGGLVMFLVSFMMGITNGAGIIISQCFGSKKFGDLRSSVVNLIYIVALLTVVSSIVGVFVAEPILKILGTPDNVMADAVLYTRIVFAFMIGMACYNVCGAILRSLGDSKTPLYALIISCGINVCLDLVFVIVFKWGVAGVAAATIIAQCVSALFCMNVIRKNKKELNLEHLEYHIDKMMVKKIFKTGLPAALESCLIALGTMSVQSLVNSFGSMTMAAYTAATKIDSIAIMPIVTIGAALSVFTGQNMGADNIERIKKGLKQTLIAQIIICAVITALIFIFKKVCLGLFLDSTDGSEAIEIGCRYLSIVSIAYFMAAMMRTYLNVLRGAGDVNTSALAGMTELVVRIIFAYILVKPLGSTGIWIATPIAWGSGALVPVIRYYSGKWKEKKLV